MRTADFHFHLPPELIAQHPPTQRDAARMLTLDRASGQLADRHFTDLPSLLRPSDLLILNDTRVIPARLYARRAGQHTQPNSPAPTGLIEILLTRQLNQTDWRALVKPARKVQPGETLSFQKTTQPEIPETALSHPHETTRTTPKPGAPCLASETWVSATPQPTRTTTNPETPTPNETLTATVLTAGDHGERTLRFHTTPNFFATLQTLGHIPLPPYLHRPDTPEDHARYQTVFAAQDQSGSAAAPTAGLHFTPAILADIQNRGIHTATLTLHVGLGTFQPVRVEHLADIRLHAEPYTLPPTTAEALNRARRDRRRIVAIGTTAVRTLEHCAAQANQDPTRPWLNPATPTATPSTTPHEPPPQRELHPHTGETSIFLAPGHQFQLTDALLTNFHLPASTLLMLVSAFAGTPNVLHAYHHAVAQRYRFFSYGDCMLLT